MLLIEEFLKTINMDFGETLEQENMVLIEIEGGLMLSLWAYEQKVVATAILGAVPEGQESAVYAKCMEANFGGFPDIPYFFALNPGSGELVIIGSWGVAETAFEQFLASVTKFTRTALEWNGKLAQQPATPEKHDEVGVATEHMLANKV